MEDNERYPKHRACDHSTYHGEKRCNVWRLAHPLIWPNTLFHKSHMSMPSPLYQPNLISLFPKASQSPLKNMHIVNEKWFLFVVVKNVPFKPLSISPQLGICPPQLVPCRNVTRALLTCYRDLNYMALLIFLFFCEDWWETWDITDMSGKR